MNQFHSLSYLGYWISHYTVRQLQFPNTAKNDDFIFCSFIGTQSPLYTWTWSHHSSPPVIPPSHYFWICRISVCMTWNNNSSAPALKVLKHSMFSPEGNLQNSDMSPRMKNRFKVLGTNKMWLYPRHVQFQQLQDSSWWNIILTTTWDVSVWEEPTEQCGLPLELWQCL